MRDGGSYQFGLLVPGTPAFLSTWRRTGEWSVWDRHYLVGPGHALTISGGRRLEVIRRRMTAGGLRVESELANSTFPLDWMVATVLAQVLPRRIHAAAAGARGEVQALVDALAVDWLAQASVHKHTRTFVKGRVTATLTRLDVPDWRARGIHLDLAAPDAGALLALLGECRLSPRDDLPLDAWLADAHRRASRGAAPRAA
ncbi:hypothetical protein [Acuticoccus sediminis]|nr:hypothetical protein [Acuticoccus sediminis]